MSVRHTCSTPSGWPLIAKPEERVKEALLEETAQPTTKPKLNDKRARSRGCRHVCRVGSPQMRLVISLTYSVAPTFAASLCIPAKALFACEP